jgi:hypothetical protein
METESNWKRTHWLRVEKEFSYTHTHTHTHTLSLSLSLSLSDVICGGSKWLGWPAMPALACSVSPLRSSDKISRCVLGEG